MELWRFECQKLWKSKLACMMILACFFLNALFLLRQMKSYDISARCFPESIKEVYDELAEIPGQEKMVWLEEACKDVENISIPDAAEDSDAVYERRNALQNVLDHIQKVNQYESYLTGIEEQARLISSSALFSQADSFSRRNAAVIPDKYLYLHGLKLEVENSQGILFATESKMTDFFLAALIILLAYFSFCMEREEGTMAFARTAKYGAKRLGRIKIAVILTGSMIGTFFLYASNFMIAGTVYGFGNLGRWVQSVGGYLTSPWKISVGWYIMLFLAGKLLAAAAIAGIVIWIVLWEKGILRTSMALICVVVLEYGLYQAIPIHSWLDLLRQCNLFYFMETEHFFQSYETVNLFGYPVSSLLVCAISGMIIIATALFVSAVSYERVSRAEYAANRPKKQIWKRKKRIKGHTLGYYESYKIFLTGGAGFLVVAFCILQFMVYSGEKPYFTLDELYYKNYIQKLGGEVTAEKLNFIEMEGNRIFGLEKELSKLAENENNLSEAALSEKIRSLEQQLSCRAAYSQIRAQAERIGTDGIFLDEVGYAYLLEKRQQLYQIGKLLLIWILAFHPVFILEKIAGMPVIWNSVPKGKEKIFAKKWTLLAVSIIFLCVISDIIFTVYRMKTYGISSLSFPVCNLPGFERWGFLSIRGYLMLLCVLKMLLGGLVCQVIAAASKKAKNATAVLLVSGSIAGVFYLALNIII